MLNINDKVRIEGTEEVGTITDIEVEVTYYDKNEEDGTDTCNGMIEVTWENGLKSYLPWDILQKI